MTKHPSEDELNGRSGEDRARKKGYGKIGMDQDRTLKATSSTLVPPYLSL